MGLFSEEGFKVVVQPQFKLISSFKKLIHRDRTKDKKQSTLELAYIYYIEDVQSPYFIYAEEERCMRVKESLGLLNWKEDKFVIQARETYKELSQTPTVMALKILREGLLTSRNVISAMTKDLNKKISELDVEDEDYEDVIDSLSKRVTKLIELSDKLPKAVESITTLEEKVRKEETGTSKIRGGGTVGKFED